MPEKSYFLRLSGAFLVGVAALAAAIVLVFLLSPYILPFIAALLPFLAGSLLFVVAVVVIWVLIYFFAMLGVAIYYAVKHPAEVNSESKGYELKNVSESGRREKSEEDE